MTMPMRDLIRSVRACKTANEERATISKELAYIRTMLKNDEQRYRERNMHKLLYMHMMGYATEFAQMECVRLIASSNFAEKRTGYLAMMILLDEESEVLRLATNSLQQDLNSKNQYVVALALTTIANIGSSDMLRDLAKDIDRLLKTLNHYTRKKAAICAIRMFKMCPDLISDHAQRVISLMTDRNHCVLLSGITLMGYMVQMKPSISKKFAKLIPALCKILKKLVSVSNSPDYSIGNVTDPFLQTKILRLMGFIGERESSAVENLNDALANAATNTDGSKTTGYAVLYECVRTIVSVDCESGLRTLAVNLLGRFLMKKDNNIRYVALSTLKRIVEYDPDAVKRHRGTIVDCLRDPDVSIRRRALELVVALVDEDNVKKLTGEMLNFLIVADKNTCSDICLKIASTARRFAPSLRWEIEVLMTVYSVAGNYCQKEIFARLIFLIGQADEKDHMGIIHKMFTKTTEELDLPEVQIDFIHAAVWCVGEYGDMLLDDPPEESPEEIDVAGSRGTRQEEGEIVAVLDRVHKHHAATTTTKAMVLSALMKLLVRFNHAESTNRIRKIVKSYRNSLDMELQQRAVEYDIMSSDTQSLSSLREKLLARMPAMKESTLVLRSGVATTDVHEAVNALDATEAEQEMNVSHENNEKAPSASASGHGASSQTQETGNSDDDYLIDIFGPAPSRTDNAGATDVGVDDLGDLFGAVNVNGSSQHGAQTNNFNSSAASGSRNQVDAGDSRNNHSQAYVQNQANKRLPSFVAHEDSSRGLRITFDLAKPYGEDNEVTDIRARASCSASTSLENFKMLAAVPKSMKVVMKPASGDRLEPSNGNEITQRMRTNNPQYKSKPLAMKLKLTFTQNGENHEEVVTVPNFPEGT